MLLVFDVFFFFKQKTAYEMRISDWSSDVCSSDLPGRTEDLPIDVQGTAFQQAVWEALRAIPPGETRSYAQIAAAMGKPGAIRAAGSACGDNRSEEHTSELQSLMRISYAVFCLKKKNNHKTNISNVHVEIALCCTNLRN